VKCIACGLLFVNPRPNDKQITESHTMGMHHGDIIIDYIGSFSQSKVNRYNLILKDFFDNRTFGNNKKWLDIGCGFGELILSIKEFSNGMVNVEGVEPNVKKREIAKQNGLDVSKSINSTNQYDFISALNIYSHLPNPIETIKEWKKCLKSNGEVFLQTGNSANLSSEEHHRPFGLPDHLSFASEEIVCNILMSAGFEIVSVKKYPFVKKNYISFLKEFIKFLLPDRTSKIRYILNASKYQYIDMFIRARLKS